MFDVRGGGLREDGDSRFLNRIRERGPGLDQADLRLLSLLPKLTYFPVLVQKKCSFGGFVPASDSFLHGDFRFPALASSSEVLATA